MFKNTGWLDASGPRAKELLERKAREHKVKLPSGLRFVLLFAACAPIAAVNGVSARRCCVCAHLQWPSSERGRALFGYTQVQCEPSSASLAACERRSAVWLMTGVLVKQ